MTAAQMSPLWRCLACGREFANRNQSHSCGTYTLESHLGGKSETIRDIFDAFVAAVEAYGPVRVIPEKTRIAFQVRMSFAQLTLRKTWVDGHLVLARRVDDPRFRSVQTISPRNHVHTFRLTSKDDVDSDLCIWIKEARAVGAQEHLRR